METKFLSENPETCTHSKLPEIKFDKDDCDGNKLTAEQVRAKYPRGYDFCTDCGSQCIRYASFYHYIYGDW